MNAVSIQLCHPISNDGARKERSLLELSAGKWSDVATVNALNYPNCSLMAPLKGYYIHVCGDSTVGVTPTEWVEVQTFWVRYFTIAGAASISYETDCQIGESRRPL